VRQIEPMLPGRDFPVAPAEDLWDAGVAVEPGVLVELVLDLSGVMGV
jgi:hypothetical protein